MTREMTDPQIPRRDRVLRFTLTFWLAVPMRNEKFRSLRLGSARSHQLNVAAFLLRLARSLASFSALPPSRALRGGRGSVVRARVWDADPMCMGCAWDVHGMHNTRDVHGMSHDQSSTFNLSSTFNPQCARLQLPRTVHEGPQLRAHGAPHGRSRRLLQARKGQLRNQTKITIIDLGAEPLEADLRRAQGAAGDKGWRVWSIERILRRGLGSQLSSI